MERFQRASAAERSDGATTESPPGTDAPSPPSAADVAARIERVGARVARRERARAHRRIDEPTARQRAAIDELADALATRLVGPAAAMVAHPEADEALASDALALFADAMAGTDRPADD